VCAWFVSCLGRQGLSVYLGGEKKRNQSAMVDLHWARDRAVSQDRLLWVWKRKCLLALEEWFLKKQNYFRPERLETL